jgi:hypothetical protein
MPIRCITFFTYRTDGGEWTPAQIGVLRFVRAIKNEPLAQRGTSDSGYVLVNGVEPKRLLRQQNAHEALEWFAEMAVPRIRKELGTMRSVLVPIPNADCAMGERESRTRRLADAIAARSPVTHVADVLRWNQPMVPAHRGGPREAHLLLPHLRVVGGWRPTARPHVLVDDVKAGAGHILASAAILRAVGASVRLAICGAQADSLFAGDPYQERRAMHLDFEIPR